jgi:hypothetical protein
VDGLQVAQVGVPFLWCGAVLAISFLEAPLKFRAPGITVPLGLGIGVLVFRALNRVELVLAAALVAVVLAAPPGGGRGVAATVLLVLVCGLLLGQVCLVRPRLNRRSRRVLAGEDLPRSRLHLAYVAPEVVKVLALPVLGTVLAIG